MTWIFANDYEGPETEWVSRVPAGTRTVDELLESVKRFMKYPPYCGDNWDAVDECIQSLEEVEEDVMVLVHEDMLEGLEREQRDVYLDVLVGAEQHWSNLEPKRLIVVFPRGAEGIVEQAMRKRRDMTEGK
jgi:hypothetical protein